MKAKFKKLSLLVHHRDRESTTNMLQELGVVHLALDTSFRNDSIEDIELRKNRLKGAIDTIHKYATNESFESNPESSSAPSVDVLVEQILILKSQKDSQIQELEMLRKNKLKLLPWGDFHLDKLQRLTQSGIEVTFFVADRKVFKAYSFAELAYQVIHQSLNKVFFVVFSKGDLPSLPFETVEIPSVSLTDLTSKEKELSSNEERLTKSVDAYYPYLPLLSKALVDLKDQEMFQVANASYFEHGNGTILHLTGWFPTSLEARLSYLLKQRKYAYTFTEPELEDKVPVLLKNPKYPKLFESITNIFQLPGAYEMDLTPFIAVFYPILFAYCLGDAGYGSILFSGAMIGWFSFLKGVRNIAALGMVLGAFTTLMGIVKSGSVFGLPIIDDHTNPLFQFLSGYVMIPDDREVVFNAFNVALMIGVVQIIFGILISISNRIYYKSLIAGIPQIGKLFIVVSLIWMFLADMQGVVVLQPFPEARHVILVLGVLLLLLFHDMKVPILSRAASGILPLFFILTGILGDVLSYVRLFALGVASSVLGLVVNQIGLQIMGNNWWGFLIGIVFLLLGHSLNFALASLGAFVHPLRLTFVEFYNNAQFEGGGMPYRPFRKTNI